MAIIFDKEKRTFTLRTKNTTYQMQIGPLGYLLHLYYGRAAEGTFDYLHLTRDCGFSPNPHDFQQGRGCIICAMRYAPENTRWRACPPPSARRGRARRSPSPSRTSPRGLRSSSFTASLRKRT